MVQFTNPQNRERISVFLKQISCGDLFTVFLTTAGEVHTCGAGLYMGMPEWMDRNSAQTVRVDTLVGEHNLESSVLKSTYFYLILFLYFNTTYELGAFFFFLIFHLFSLIFQINFFKIFLLVLHLFTEINSVYENNLFIDIGSNISTIAAGASHVIAITSPTGGSGSGDIYTWGCGSSGQLGLGDDVYNIERCHVQIPRRVQV